MASSEVFEFLDLPRVEHDTANLVAARQHDQLPRYPVGMVLLARLAVDETEHGNGFAVAFYEHFGFIRTPGYPRRLYRRMKDTRASLGSV